MNIEPVIFGGFVNGYSLARTFYETYNIKSTICDVKRNVAYYSKFCKYIIVENPNKDIDKFINEIKNIGKKIKNESKTPLLLVTNDIWLIPLAKYKNELDDIFIYTFPGWDIIDKYVNKNKLYELSNSLGVPYPKNLNIYSKNNIDIEQLDFPILIKPIDVNEYSYFFPDKKRNYIFETKDNTYIHLEFIYSKNYTGGLIVQEYIPGGVENLYTCTSFSDSSGKVKAVSTGCKLSQFPVEAGTITAGLVKYNKEIIELTKTLLESNNFFGIANTEFKYDKRNNTFKLIEVNARPGMWNYSVFLSGINLINLLVDDLIFKKTLTYSEGTNSLIWTRVTKRELLKNLESYENKSEILKLLETGKIFDPLDNKNDGFIFKLRYYLSNFKYNINMLKKAFMV